MKNESRKKRIKRFRRWLKPLSPDFKWIDGKVWITYKNYLYVQIAMMDEIAASISLQMDVCAFTGKGN